MRSEPGSPDAPVILRVEHVRLGYPARSARCVLDAVDLSISLGEFWFLLGPNGTGKTTLLHALLGLLEPLAGRIWRHPEHAARPRIGFVPQQCSLSQALPTTVREFVSLGSIGGDRTRSSRPGDLAWALERAHLAGMEESDDWSLSGGQRQRALVARALVRRPSLLLLDEPTEGMDLGSQDDFLLTLEELRRKHGSTLLFVTHHLDIAARYSSHLALLHDGRLLSGARGAVLATDFLAAAYGRHAASVARLLDANQAVGDDPR